MADPGGPGGPEEGPGTGATAKTEKADLDPEAWEGPEAGAGVMF